MSSGTPVTGRTQGALMRALKRYVAATPGLTLTGTLRQAGIAPGRAYWMNRAGDKLTFKTAAEVALAIGAPIGQFLEAVAWEMGVHPAPTAPKVLCRLPLARSRGPGRPRVQCPKPASGRIDYLRDEASGELMVELPYGLLETDSEAARKS